MFKELRNLSEKLKVMKTSSSLNIASGTENITQTQQANQTMTAKTAAEDLLSGLMLLHAVIRLLDLDTSTPVGKAILGLTVVAMIIQVATMCILLATTFINYDDPKKRHTVETLTKVSTTLIVVLSVFDTIATGLLAYVSVSRPVGNTTGSAVESARLLKMET